MHQDGTPMTENEETHWRLNEIAQRVHAIEAAVCPSPEYQTPAERAEGVRKWAAELAFKVVDPRSAEQARLTMTLAKSLEDYVTTGRVPSQESSPPASDSDA